MQKLFLLILLLLCSSPAYASLTMAQWVLADAAQANYATALTAASNVKNTMSAASYIQSGWYVSNGVEILGPVGAATAELAAPTLSVIGESGSMIIAKKALGLLGPVATAVTIAMTLHDLYNTAILHPTDYPLTSSLGSTSAYQTVGLYNNVGDIIYDTYHGINQGRQISSVLLWKEPNNFNPPNTTQWDSGGVTVTGPKDSWSVGYQKVNSYFFPNVQVSPPVQSAPEPVWTGLYTAPGTAPYLQPAYQDESNKILKTALATDQALMNPTSDKIKTLSENPDIIAADKAKTAAQSAQDAADKAKQAATANPTDPNLANTANALQAAADALKAQQAAADAQAAKDKAAEDALVPPPVPNNTYDASITPPDKKSIPELLLSFVSGSPLVSMVKSFSVTTSSPSCSQPIGMVYGQELSFDFCRWEPYLKACGGMLIIIMSGFSILIVIRGW